MSVTDFEEILKKIELLEKMGAEIPWGGWKKKGRLPGDFKERLLEDLLRELNELDKKFARGGGVKEGAPVPVAGWKVRTRRDGMVEYTREGEIWLWDPRTGRWKPPLGHPDPNPITPTGERLGGPGTM